MEADDDVGAASIVSPTPVRPEMVATAGKDGGEGRGGGEEKKKFVLHCQMCNRAHAHVPVPL